MIPRALSHRIQTEQNARQFSPGCVDSANIEGTVRSQFCFERPVSFAVYIYIYIYIYLCNETLREESVCC